MTAAPTAEREAEIRAQSENGFSMTFNPERAIRDLLALLDAERAKQHAQEAGAALVWAERGLTVALPIVSKPTVEDGIRVRVKMALDAVRAALARSGQAVRT